MLSVLWQTNIGAFAEDFLQLTPAQANALRTFALSSVRASGPIPRCASAASRTACCR